MAGIEEAAQVPAKLTRVRVRGSRLIAASVAVVLLFPLPALGTDGGNAARTSQALPWLRVAHPDGARPAIVD
jgi:hypothetical protein